MSFSPSALTLGLPRMHKEPGERPELLPSLVERAVALGVRVCCERGIGVGMGLTDRDFAVSPLVRFVDNAEERALCRARLPSSR